jgi:hypothetical protein
MLRSFGESQNEDRYLAGDRLGQHNFAASKSFSFDLWHLLRNQPRLRYGSERKQDAYSPE